MILHAYFTDGFLPWARLFLESFGYHNGQTLPIKLDAINLNEAAIAELYKLYDNLEIFNREMDLKKLATTHNITYKKFLKQKKTIETLHITPDSKDWKLLVAGDLRVKAIYDMLNFFPEEDILHFDIDTYFRGDISPVMDIVNSNDICVRFRLNHSKINRKTLIAVQGYKNNKNSRHFLEEWINIIESKPLKRRPIGWGQTSHYKAYLKCKDLYRWSDVPIQYYSVRRWPDDKVWGANTPEGKTINLKKYREDFNRMKREK